MIYILLGVDYLQVCLAAKECLVIAKLVSISALCTWINFLKLILVFYIKNGLRGVHIWILQA